MRDKFYDSVKWNRKREKILRRDKYLCVECRRYGRKDKNGKPIRATIVHHIKPRETNPELSLIDSNLESLCAACHNKKHPERAQIYRNPPHPTERK
ncbi:MAG: HNH endonuclease [Eubacteriales bacterium]